MSKLLIDAREALTPRILRLDEIHRSMAVCLEYRDEPNVILAIGGASAGGARKLIEEAPGLDVAPVIHGRWIKMTGMMPPEYHGHYECSECQWHMKGLRNSWTREEEMAYCPNCGAKMDGGGDDADG